MCRLANTFFAPLIATFLHPNVVHLVYDLFPEAMIHSGKWMEGALKHASSAGSLADIEARKDKRLSRSTAQGLCGIDPRPSRECCDHPDRSGPSALFEKSVERRSLNPQSSPTILYCGNFGNMHDSVTLFDYWKRSDEQGIHCNGRFIVLGRSGAS